MQMLGYRAHAGSNGHVEIYFIRLKRLENERMVTRATSAAAVSPITLEYYFHCGIQ